MVTFIGALILAIPLLIIVGFTIKQMGWKEAFVAWGVAIGLTGMIVVGLKMVLEG